MLRKINRKAKKRVFTLIFLFVFFMSSQVLMFSSPVSASVEEGDLSVKWGDNIYQNLPYNYTGTFYENTDPTDAWDTAKIEFTYIPDTTINDEYVITDSFDNSETEYPLNSSFSMINGTHYQNGTLDSLDNDYHIFNSTESIILVPEQPTDFNLINGTSNFEGNLKFIDSNYTIFYSEESGHYPATYSFTNETDGTSGTDITFIDYVSIDASCSATICGANNEHRKILDLYDNNNAGKVLVSNSFNNQMTGTVECYIMSDDVSAADIFLYIDDDDTDYYTESLGIRIWNSNLLYFDGGTSTWEIALGISDNVWYHIKISFSEASNTYDLYVNGVSEASGVPFRADPEQLNRITFSTDNAELGFHYYIDAIGFSWDSNYNIGDNLLPNNPLNLNFTVDTNLSDFTNLDDLNIFYSYKTNIKQLINFSIWNFDSLEYNNIEYSINESFNSCYFEINSSYYNSTKDLILNFEMVNSSFTEFQFQLEMLKIRHPSYLNFTTYTTLFYLSNLLQLDFKSYQRSNITQLITISAWNYTSNNWVVLDSESFISSFQLSEYTSSIFSGFINENGKIFLNYYGINKTDNFRFEIDKLELKTWRKTRFNYEKTLQLLGTWKYRFKLDMGLGTEHITDWIYFNVVEQPPNFEGISESRYSTRWVLTSTATTGELTEVYYDNLTSGYWDLSDFSSRTFTKNEYSIHDTWVHKSNPDTNYNGDYYAEAGQASDDTDYNRLIYLGFPDSDYLNSNTTDLSNIRMYLFERNSWTYGDSELRWYSTSSFDEDTLTWTNRPSWDSTICNHPEEQNGYWYDLGTTTYDQWYILRDLNYYETDGSSYWQCYTDYGGDPESTWNPRIQREFNKNYHTTSEEGYSYFQAGTTETLGLISPKSSSNTSLNEGDVFTVDLQSTSDNALLKLYSGGVLQQTINLLTATTETSRQEVEVIVSEDVSYDQIKITSELGDTESLKLYDIKAEHWVFEDEEAQKIMYVEPYGQNELILNLGNNSLKIYENDILRTDTYITMTYDLTTHIFESPIPETVFVSFYDSNNDYLDFNEFTTYVNYTLFEENFINQRLTSREFYVDEDSTIYFNVYDSFDVNIYSASRLAKTFIDITLNVYTLKIKNEALDDSSYTLTKGSVSKTGILFPDEIDEYKIASGTYTFAYIKGSDPEESIDLTLSGDKLLKINRSQMCFLSYTNQRGEYLNFNQFKTYWNGTLLYENVFYEDIGNNVSIEIRDHYDISVKNHTFIVSSGDNYVPVILTMFSLKVFNQQELFNHINITRDPNYYESGYSWSEWVAPTEIIEFELFAGFYKINLTDNENSGSSYYSYTLNGDDVLLISSGNTISNLIINIANVNTTIGNQITNVQIDLTNQNSNINNTIINIDINLSNINSSLGTLLTNINLDIININNNISNLYTFTENNFLNLGNNINNSFISIENNIIAINQTISTLVIGLDGKITVVNATINTMFTEMNSQFIVTQSTLDFSFTFLNQTITQIGNNITENHIALNNLIIQRANEIDNSLIQISTLVNLINSSVVNESLVIQSLVNIIGNNITENHVIINDLINLIGNNITENNINMVSLIELVGNNITTNHFVIQTLIDYVSNNITDNHLEFLTNINLINNTIGQNQIELINRLLFINNSINTMALDLTNQILLVNNTIYSAILEVSTSIDFNSDNILGNISLTYQQNDFLTELYQTTMFSQLLNWSDVAYNYSLMEDRIDVWEFINLNRDDAGIVYLRYNDLIDNLTVSAQNTIEQFLPTEDVEYRVWSVEDQEYLDEWQPLPANRTVPFGFYEAEIPFDPEPITNTFLTYLIVVIFFVGLSFGALKLYSGAKERKNEVPPELVNLTSKPHKKKQKGVVDNRL